MRGFAMLRSLRLRVTFWITTFVIFVALVVRYLNYHVTQDILVHDIDTQLWTRLGALKTQQQFAADTLLNPTLPLGSLLLPPLRSASDWKPSVAMRFLMPSEIAPDRHAKPFPCFAAVLRADGTVIQSLALPDNISWAPACYGHRETLWNTPQNDYRLAACTGTDETLLLVGTPLSHLKQAMRDVVWFYTWTLALSFFPIAIILWAILSQIMKPLKRISQTARRITQGHFEERIDIAHADSELVGMCETINGMLDRLNAIRISQLRFNANVAHEIRNPIHGILMQTDVSQERARSTVELTHTVAHCRALALRLEALSDALLSLAKAESVASESLSTIDLEPILEEAIEQVSGMARAKLISLHASVKSAVVHGNADLLHQVFVNLLANAIQHTPLNGKVDIALLHAGGRWIVRVIDHGIGISPENVDGLFNRFFREARAGNTAREGHGLGLAICKSIMHGHRGDVVHVATPGGGATFEVQFARD
ncbi:MAG: ATP-binding protein [Planctomycetota bacterium]